MTDTNSGIIIGHLLISYDRGAARNKPEDLGLDSEPEETSDGGRVRGLGTHWRSDEARARTEKCMQEERRIRKALKDTFVSAPFKGTVVLPDTEAGQRFLRQLDPQPDSDVRVSMSTYVLGVLAQTSAAMNEWNERVARQIQKVPLGRGKDVAADALNVLTNLAYCPVIGSTTRDALLALIEDAKLARVKRVDFKRRLSSIKVDVAGTSVTPRRPKRPTARSA